MFCPNCGKENGLDQNYCRACGLKLGTITEAVAAQFPSKEYGELQRRKHRFEKLGLLSLSIAGVIGAGFVLFKAAYYKLILFGPDVLFWSGIGALIVSLLLAVFFFNYPKLFMKFEKVNPRVPVSDEAFESNPTAKLIDDRPFEPVPSVTEHSTELLLKSSKKVSSK